MSFRLPSQPMPFPRPSTPPNRPVTPTSPCPMDVSSTPVVSSTSLPSTSSIQFPQPPSSTPFPSVQNYPASPIRPGAFARTRRPSLLSLAIERTNKPSSAGVGLGNGNGSGTGLGSAAFIDPSAPSRRPRGYTATFLASSSNSSLSLCGGSSDAAMLSPTSSTSQREDSGMITPLEEPPLGLPVGDMNRDRRRSRDRRNGIIGGGDDIVRDLPTPKTPPRAMNDTVLPTATPGFKRGPPLKPSRLLMLQSELVAPPTDIETRSEAAFQRLLSTSSDLAQTLGLQIPGSRRGRTRKKSGLGNRYPESVGGGESDRDVGSRDRGGGGGTKADEDTTSSEDGEGDDTFVLQKEATWDMELQVGSVGLERGFTMEAGSGMDVDMNDRSALSSPRSSISMPFQWRERSNPAYNRPGKRKFSDAQLLDPHSLSGNGNSNGGGPLSKRRRGGSPSPFPQPRSPIVHGRNHSNPWQARMPSALSGRERDKDRDRDASSDFMDGAMSAKSSPVLRPTSSHGLGGALGLNGVSIGSSLLGLQHTSGNGSGGNGNTNGGSGGGAGVGIPINIPVHTPASSIGMGMSPGASMSGYMLASGLGGGTGGSPSLRPMHRLPRRAGVGGQQEKSVQEGVGGLRIQGSR